MEAGGGGGGGGGDGKGEESMWGEEAGGKNLMEGNGGRWQSGDWIGWRIIKDGGGKEGEMDWISGQRT